MFTGVWVRKDGAFYAFVPEEQYETPRSLLGKEARVTAKSGNTQQVKLSALYISCFYHVTREQLGSLWIVEKLPNNIDSNLKKEDSMKKKDYYEKGKYAVGTKHMLNFSAYSSDRTTVFTDDVWVPVVVSDVRYDDGDDVCEANLEIDFKLNNSSEQFEIYEIAHLHAMVRDFTDNTKENNNMAQGTAKKTTKARVTEAVKHGSKVAVVDEAANTLLALAKNLNNPLIDAALQTPEGRSVVKLLMSISVTTCVNADIIPGVEDQAENIMAACGLVTEAASRDILQSSLQQVVPELVKLAKVGAKLVSEK